MNTLYIKQPLFYVPPKLHRTICRTNPSKQNNSPSSVNRPAAKKREIKKFAYKGEYRDEMVKRFLWIQTWVPLTKVWVTQQILDLVNFHWRKRLTCFEILRTRLCLRRFYYICVCFTRHMYPSMFSYAQLYICMIVKNEDYNHYYWKQPNSWVFPFVVDEDPGELDLGVRDWLGQGRHAPTMNTLPL